jgi:hypothetical protein
VSLTARQTVGVFFGDDMTSQTFLLAAFSGPHVRALADYMDVSEDYARGLLLRWWSECESMIDKAMNLEGFARGLIHAGLLIGVEEAAQANGEAPPAKPTRRRKTKAEPVEPVATEPAKEPEVATEPKPAATTTSPAHQAEMIYEAYPRKVARPAAIQAIRRALQAKSFDWLLGQVERYAEAVEGQSKKFVPHPATWFNQARYDDDPKEWAQSDTGPDLFGGIRQVQREMIGERAMQPGRLPAGDGSSSGGNAEDGDTPDDPGLSPLPF